MEALRFLAPDLRALDGARAEVCAVPVFADERPFRAVAGLLDWRLAGRLSALARDGFVSGHEDEVVLVVGRPRLPFDKLLLCGTGARGAFSDDTFRRWLVRVDRAVSELRAKRAVVELAGRALLTATRRAELLAEATLGPDALDRFVFVDDEEGQLAIVSAMKRSEHRTRTA